MSKFFKSMFYWYNPYWKIISTSTENKSLPWQKKLFFWWSKKRNDSKAVNTIRALTDHLPWAQPVNSFYNYFSSDSINRNTKLIVKKSKKGNCSSYWYNARSKENHIAILTSCPSTWILLKSLECLRLYHMFQFKPQIHVLSLVH